MPPVERMFRSAVLLLALASGGCVERFINVKSEPAGATVMLDDVKIGVTPVDIPYTWYGKRLLVVDLPEYVSVREVLAINPPWWQYFPLDFITDVLIPFTLTYRSEFAFKLEKAVVTEKEVEAVKRRAAELREKANGPP